MFKEHHSNPGGLNAHTKDQLQTLLHPYKAYLPRDIVSWRMQRGVTSGNKPTIVFTAIDELDDQKQSFDRVIVTPHLEIVERHATILVTPDSDLGASVYRNAQCIRTYIMLSTHQKKIGDTSAIPLRETYISTDLRAIPWGNIDPYNPGFYHRRFMDAVIYTPTLTNGWRIRENKAITFRFEDTMIPASLTVERFNNAITVNPKSDNPIEISYEEYTDMSRPIHASEEIRILESYMIPAFIDAFALNPLLEPSQMISEFKKKTLTYACDTRIYPTEDVISHYTGSQFIRSSKKI